MVNIQSVPSKHGVIRSDSDTGLVTSGTFGWTAAEDSTSEKRTSAITLSAATNTEVHPDGLYLLAIEKPVQAGTGDITIYTYNRISIDGTNSRDVLHTSHTVENVTSSPTYRDFLVQGLFVGDGAIKIGGVTTSDTAVSITYKLFRL